MQSTRSKSLVISGCSWCCGDLHAEDLSTDARAVCAECGRLAPEVGAATTGARAYERRLALSLGTEISMSDRTWAMRRKTAKPSATEPWLKKDDVRRYQYVCR